MKKKISVLLCLAMMLTLLAGCGGDDLTGTWEANIDVTDVIDSGMVETLKQSIPELEEYVDLSGLTLTVKVTFNEDGTYATTISDESFVAMMEVAAGKAATGFTEYINKIIADSKLDVTIEEIVNLEEGQTIEEKLKSEFSSEEFKKIIDESVQSGVYKAKDGKLFTAETEEDFDDTKFETYTLNGDTLELTGSEGMEEDVNSTMTKKYPITYKKIG